MDGSSIFYSLSFFWYWVGAAAVLFTVFYVYRANKKIPNGFREEAAPKGNILLTVIVLSFLAPVVAPLIFHFGWKKKFPERIKQDAIVGWSATIIALIIIGILYTLLHL